MFMYMHVCSSQTCDFILFACIYVRQGCTASSCVTRIDWSVAVLLIEQALVHRAHGLKIACPGELTLHVHKCRVRSESEAQKHMRRRKKRKREKISKSQTADPAEPDVQEAETAAHSKEEEDEALTAADELAPLQVGMALVHSCLRKAAYRADSLMTVLDEE